MIQVDSVPPALLGVELEIVQIELVVDSPTDGFSYR